MEEEQKALYSFVHLHANRLRDRPAKDPHVVYMAPFSPVSMPLDITLEPYTVDEIREAFDTNSTLVRWLLRQVETYNPEREIILGLIFDKTRVLAHVIQRPELGEQQEED